MPVSYLRTLTCAAALFMATGPVALAEGLAGAYLAGRAATYDNDFAASAQYYTRALVRDSQNATLMENLLYAQLALGEVRAALPVAQRMWEQGARSQVANIVMAGNFALQDDYDALLSRDVAQFEISPLVDGLLNAWAYMGQGAVSQALQQFDQVAKQDGLQFFATYHKALALASVGDYEGAEALFSANGGQLGRSSRRAAIARVQILSQLGQNDAALTVLVDSFGAGFDPALTDLADRLSAGEATPFTVAASPRAGMAEVFYSLGQALSGEAANDYVLMYARMASVLSPDHIDAVLLSAGLLDQLGRYQLSIATYKQVPRDHPDFHAAELGRAEALRRAANPQAAAEVLEQLARDFPEHLAVHVDLGDLMRQQEDYTGAVAAYNRALDLSEPDAQNRWFLLYARGICNERLKNWEAAEADFRAALVIDPDQPQVLNYLGYSLVEREEKLDEALAMIERAVSARPESGYIVDSLGWVLYRLGRYDDAVGHMERAVELMPVDPVVNDHLGDVYWAVGRRLEAEFQWKRALSFVDPEDTDAEADPVRIRRKLDVGLDLVLSEEGAPPLKVANDDS
ncbi:tetratricopeptide repeat protein [Phaeobacter sp. B1627]|uniref:tetratricopeptide repeat protein n=1 Tax=Phaeobacter sp. B1627 TaxID=2583809 RepID=UPI0011196901|nr:tetratricopeptide repeat protein [Phaeobacter sp. B1627]TNJ47645.1 tetratricopeptide repeat protein [Phaeobacter sp. B1627]